MQCNSGILDPNILLRKVEAERDRLRAINKELVEVLEEYVDATAEFGSLSNTRQKARLVLAKTKKN